MGVIRCTFELHAAKTSQLRCIAVETRSIIDSSFSDNPRVHTNGFTEKCDDHLNSNLAEKSSNTACSQLFSHETYRVLVDIFSDCIAFDIAVQVASPEACDAAKAKFRSMLDILKSIDNVREVRQFPFMEHGLNTMHKFFETSDGRMIEYELKNLVFSARSNYQLVEIFDTVQFGRLLVLDKFQQLAESDLIYTTSIMRQGRIQYANRQVLILGGGDGALLHEILKEQPAHVVVVDIDEMVVKAVREHMRGVCGDALDTYQSTRHTILIGDAFKFLEQAAAEHRQYDIVISDLTDFPIMTNGAATTTTGDDQWKLLKKIIDLSMPCLKSAENDGHFLIHGVGRSALETLKQFEELLDKFEQPGVKQLKWERHEAFVPSFLEYWQFYDVQKF